MDGLEPRDGDEFDGAMFVLTTPRKLADMNPFDEGESLCTQVTKEINPTQLTDEIERAMGVAVQICIANPDPEQAVSPDNPAKLYVHPVVEVEQVDKIVKDHVPDPDYGLSAEDQRRAELTGKLAQGHALDPAELMEALQMVLRGGAGR